MRRKLTSALVALLASTAGLALAVTQEPEKSTKLPTPLKVQIVFSKYQGEKKVSSLPYTMAVNANDRATAMRMGIQVPLSATATGKEPSGVVYKDVGTSLDCSAEALDDGRFKLRLGLEQSSLSTTEPDRATSRGAAVESGIANAPLLRNFKSQTNMVLRDGETAQYIAATDPVSGEVLKIDVTLSVLK